MLNENRFLDTLEVTTYGLEQNTDNDLHCNSNEFPITLSSINYGLCYIYFLFKTCGGETTGKQKSYFPRTILMTDKRQSF